MSRGRRCVPPAPGMMPSVTSGSMNFAVGVRNAVVAGQRDFEAAADGRAVHGRDHGNLQAFEARPQLAGIPLPWAGPKTR